MRMNRKERRAIQQGKKKASIRIAREGVGADSLGHDEQGHVIVVTDRGLAMLIAGLRNIALESPEVEPLLETLEGALRDGIEERKARAEGPSRDSETGVLVRSPVLPDSLVSSSEGRIGGESDGGSGRVDSDSAVEGRTTPETA
jgi:hypothetical protein